MREWDSSGIELHSHRVSLKDVPIGDKAVFFLRDPLSRFISGFYSRKRKGRPRYYSEYSHLEVEVFNTFETPNQLALVLADDHHSDNKLARKAMEGIGHLSHFDKWYIDLEYFKTRIDDVLFIGFQETLEADFECLKELLGAPQGLALPTDDVNAHRNPQDLDVYLSQKAELALRQWYQVDYEFLRLCHTWNH